MLYRWRQKYTPEGDKTRCATLEEENKHLRLQNAEQGVRGHKSTCRSPSSDNLSNSQQSGRYAVWSDTHWTRPALWPLSPGCGTSVGMPGVSLPDCF